MDSQISYLMKNMTNDERIIFMSEVTGEKKDVAIGVLLALFLGTFGAHKFYLGQFVLGIIYFIFCWTFIPTIVSFIEALLMQGTIRRHNYLVARRAYENIRLRR